MFKKIKEIALTFGMFSILAVPLLVPVAVSAATDNSIANQLCSGSNAGSSPIDISPTSNGADCSSGANDTGNSVSNILKLIINVFSLIVGFVAVIMIIIGGVKYITSGGDSGNISGAKNTIVYAIVGLIIVALAQVIVHFVLAQSSKALNG
jgi:hypothetical protein